MAAPLGTRLQDKIAIVTGSSAGIGRAIALRYASEGAYVVCSDLNPASRVQPDDHGGKPTHEAVNSAYPAAAKASQRSVFVKVDTSVAAEVENLVQECVKRFGRLDIMVNNAGISHQGIHPPARIHDIPEASWDKIVGVNGKGVWLGCKYATGQMLSQEPHSSGDRGWIINTASILGLVGTKGASTYVASKGAVVNLTRAVALEYGNDRIHVNAIAPGYIETPLIQDFANSASDDAKVRENHETLAAAHPFGSRLGQSDEIARGALFLASDDAAFVTGHILAVDGGFLAQ